MLFRRYVQLNWKRNRIMQISMSISIRKIIYMINAKDAKPLI